MDTFDGNPEAKSVLAVSPRGIRAGGDCAETAEADAHGIVTYKKSEAASGIKNIEPSLKSVCLNTIPRLAGN